MSTHGIMVYVHLVSAVLLAGCGLFWVIMAAPGGRDERPDRAVESDLESLAGSRWPPFALPTRIRLPLPALGLAFFLLLAGTGAWLMRADGLTPHLSAAGLSAPAERMWLIKLGMSGALCIGLLAFTLRRRAWLATINAALTVGIIVASALVQR